MTVAVRIRMKMMGRKHRPYFRIVAIDAPPAARRPGDRGTGHLRSDGARTPTSASSCKPDRVKYWMSVGALPSENVAVLLKKYMEKFEQQAAEAGAAAAAADADAERQPRPTALTAMRFDVLTLFPEIFQGYLTQSLLKLALRQGPGRDPPVEHPRLGDGQAQERR